MKKEEKKLDVVFLLDKSGSMGGSEEATISSFNEYLEREKKNSYPTTITTVLFNDTYHTLYREREIKKVQSLTLEDYMVGGCTALYDALGNTIHSMEKSKKALFIIITDGYENSSKEYTKEKIRNLIQKHSNWEFIYIGADIDSYATGGEIGIKKDNIANYCKTEEGTSRLFQAVGRFECAMMDQSSSNIHWKEDLENYLEESQK